MPTSKAIAARRFVVNASLANKSKSDFPSNKPVFMYNPPMHQFPNIDKVSKAETLRHWNSHEKSNRRGKSLRTTTLKACNRLERHIGKEYAKDQQKIHRHGFNPYFDETPEESQKESQKAIQRIMLEDEFDRLYQEQMEREINYNLDLAYDLANYDLNEDLSLDLDDWDY